MPLHSTINEASIKGYVSFIIGNSYNLTQTIYENTPSANAQFGFAVDITNDGNYIAISAPPFYTNNTGTPQGEVFIYINNNNTYTHQQTLSPGPGGFGNTLSLSGDGNYIAISSYSGNSTYLPSVYVYDRSNTNWSQQANLPMGANTVNDRVVAVDLNYSGNLLAIGCDLADGNRGKVYVYERSNTTWSLINTVTGSNGSYIGNVVNLNDLGNLLFIGNPNGNIVNVREKSGNNYNTFQDITPPSNTITDFGSFIGINDDGTKISISTFDSPNTVDKRIYNYDLIGNTYTYNSTINNIFNNSSFGLGVNISNDGNIIITEISTTNLGYFENNFFVQSLSATSFQKSLDSNGNIIIVGDPFDDTQANNAGVVKIFKNI